MGSRSVVVVGAGTIGLVTGLGLARQGFDVTIVERETSPGAGPSDMVYRWCVLPFLAELGMLDGMLQRGVVCPEISLVVPATGENLRLDLGTLADVTEHPYNLHVPFASVADVATDLFAGLPNARIVWGVEVTAVQQDASGVTVTGRSREGEAHEYRGGWVVGADGSQSVVRRSLGLSFAGTTWPKHLLSCDLRLDLAALGHAVGSTQFDVAHGALIGQVDPSGLWRYTAAENRTLPVDQATERALRGCARAWAWTTPNCRRSCLTGCISDRPTRSGSVGPCWSGTLRT